MKTVTVTELRDNIEHLLDEVLASGVPLEVKKGDRTLRIARAERVDKFADMEYRPGVINGDPDELFT